MNYHIYSDGSCINNGLPNAVATWSYVVADSQNTIIQACTGKVIGEQNNNRAELTAFIRCLQYIRYTKGEFTIYVDFEALYLYCNGKSRPKSNLDLYRQIDKLHKVVGDRITVEKIQAHRASNSIVHFINGLVDKLARRSVEYFGDGGMAG